MDEDNPQYTYIYIYTHIIKNLLYIYIYNEKAAWQKPRSNHQPFQPTISYQCPRMFDA